MNEIPALVGAGQANAANEGGNSGFGTKGSFKNALDPGNLFGGSSSSILGNIIDPGNVLGLNPQMANNPRVDGVGPNAPDPNNPGTIPNLGASSLIPRMPGGGFMPVNMAGGGYNAMANQAAGQLFNPALIPPTSMPNMSQQAGASLNSAKGQALIPPMPNMSQEPFLRQGVINQGGSHGLPYRPTFGRTLQ